MIAKRNGVIGLLVVAGGVLVAVPAWAQPGIPVREVPAPVIPTPLSVDQQRAVNRSVTTAGRVVKRNGRLVLEPITTEKLSQIQQQRAVEHYNAVQAAHKAGDQERLRMLLGLPGCCVKKTGPVGVRGVAGQAAANIERIKRERLSAWLRGAATGCLLVAVGLAGVLYLRVSRVKNA